MRNPKSEKGHYSPGRWAKMSTLLQRDILFQFKNVTETPGPNVISHPLELCYIRTKLRGGLREWNTSLKDIVKERKNRRLFSEVPDR